MPAERDTEIIRQNKEYWELHAPHRLGMAVEVFREGGSALSDAETAAIGDVQGRKVLQLAGSVGDEGLTFAQRGADVTVVDIAASHLATGRTKADALGLTVSFVEQDMMSLDPSITGFDVVYISTGGSAGHQHHELGRAGSCETESRRPAGNPGTSSSVGGVDGSRRWQTVG